MLDDELAEVIENLRHLGADDADVEAKRARDQLPRSIRQSLSAFSNTRGGVIILGLDEASGFSATGVADAAKISADLASLCSTELEPELRPIVRTHQFDGVDLVVAEIAEVESQRKPCFLRGAGISNGSYVRVGDSDRKLSSYEVQTMLANRGQPRADEEPQNGVRVDDLDPAMVDNLVSRLRSNRPYAFSELDKAAVLRRAKVTSATEERGDVVTLAGLLCLSRYPQDSYPQLIITFVHYPTTTGPNQVTGERFLDSVTIEGPIPVMINDCLAVLRRNMSRRSVILGAGRSDQFEYPEPALREALVNALVHRDLSSASRGTQVQVEMYPDRLVIQNPGGLFGPVTVESLGEDGISSSRNATLLKLLEDVALPNSQRAICENRGSGIRTMLDALRNARMSPPRFNDRIASFSVTFPNHTLLSTETIKWIDSLGERGLTDGQCLGLALLKSGEMLDNQSYRSATGLDSRVATQELRDLVARELVVQTGSRRWARYQLAVDTERTSTHAEQSAAQRADRRAEILQALGDEVLSRTEIAQRAKLSDQTVSRWLRILRRENAVERTEAAPKSPHVRYRRTGQSLLGEVDGATEA